MPSRFEQLLTASRGTLRFLSGGFHRPDGPPPPQKKKRLQRTPEALWGRWCRDRYWNLYIARGPKCNPQSAQGPP
eukprot:10769212-Alexandrium_andersonii.AAC.1